MMILRLISLFLLFLVGRNLFRAWRRLESQTRRPTPPPPASGPQESADGFLTDQDISDADYEEIP
ncbi:MAG: hypothetical protein ABIK96_00635 [bacterium]|nr:hypothetical protein [bacterium]